MVSPGGSYLLLLAIGGCFTSFHVVRHLFVGRSKHLPIGGTVGSRRQPLHICRAPAFGGSETGSQKVLYQCAGQEYDVFGVHMHSFADNLMLHGETWGRRDFPLANNTNVLMLGNSHTRQVGVEMACQYSHVLRNIRRDELSDELMVFEFENNSTLFLLTNTPVVYSYEWQNLVEVKLGKLLGQFDVMVLGIFNQFPGKIITNFDTEMIAQSKNFSNVDYLTIKPPTPWDIFDRFHGPAVILSMFSKWDVKWTEFESIAAHYGERVQAMNARKYIAVLGECGSDNRNGTSKCYNDNVKREGMRLPNGMHRCTGEFGGHPDLIAWELSEVMHTLKGPCQVDQQATTPTSVVGPATRPVSNLNRIHM